MESEVDKMSHHSRKFRWFLFALPLLLIAPLEGAAAGKAPETKVFRVRVEVSPSDPKQADGGLVQEIRRSLEREVGALADTRLVQAEGQPDLVMHVTVSPEGQDRVTLAAVVLTAIDNDKLMNVFTRRCGESAQKELVSLLDKTSSAFAVYRTTWLRSGPRSESGALSRQLARQLDSEYIDELREATAVRDALQQSLRNDAPR